MAGPRAMQLELFRTALSPAELGDRLSLPGRTLKLVLTRNRGSMASVRFHPGGEVRVRLDRAFLAAPEEVHAALREYIQRPSAQAWRPVRCFAMSIPPSARRRDRPLSPKGSVYDLEPIRDSVNRQFFGGRLKSRITWGRPHAAANGRGHSIRYGTYTKADDLVRINPLLDDARVPPEFVRYIVFHELLHAAVPAEISDGRIHHHHASYRALERQYPEIRRMRRLSSELVLILRHPSPATAAAGNHLSGSRFSTAEFST